jgi:hypothetical protein
MAVSAYVGADDAVPGAATLAEFGLHHLGLCDCLRVTLL